MNSFCFLEDEQRLVSGNRWFRIKSRHHITMGGVGYDSGTGQLIIAEPLPNAEPDETDMHRSYYILQETNFQREVILEVQKSFHHIHNLLDAGKLKCK
jgi:hypothetical protein